MPKKLDPLYRQKELEAMVRALRAFYRGQNRPAVFPELGGVGRETYGDHRESGTLGYQLLEAVRCRCCHRTAAAAVPRCSR